jgi:hypothetical protein
LVRLLVTRPEMLADHVGAYAELASAEAREAATTLRKRAILMAAAAALSTLGLMLGGVALLLVAALPLQNMPAPWVLAALPLALLALAGVCVLVLRQKPIAKSFALLRQQMAQDAALLREAGGGAPT